MTYKSDKPQHKCGLQTEMKRIFSCFFPSSNETSERKGLQSQMGEQIHPKISPAKEAQAGTSNKPKQTQASTSNKPQTPSKDKKKPAKCPTNRKPKKMSDLVNSVQMNSDLSHILTFRHLVDDIERSIREEHSDWAASFYGYIQRIDKEHKEEPCKCDPVCGDNEAANMFIFRILCSTIRHTKEEDKVTELLEVARHVFFTDTAQKDVLKPAFNFASFELSPTKTSHVIERIYLDEEDLTDESTKTELKKLLRYLCQSDGNIDDHLDKQFDIFMKKEEEHPKNAFLRSFSGRSNASSSSTSSSSSSLL